MKFLVVLTILAFVLVADAGVSINNPFYCYSTDGIRPQNQMHSVRTSYEAVRRTTVNPTVSCELAIKTLVQFKNNFYSLACTPSRFWFLSRHGGRLPEVPLLQDMFDFVETSVSPKS